MGIFLRCITVIFSFIKINFQIYNLLGGDDVQIGYIATETNITNKLATQLSFY